MGCIFCGKESCRGPGCQYNPKTFTPWLVPSQPREYKCGDCGSEFNMPLTSNEKEFYKTTSPCPFCKGKKQKKLIKKKKEG